MNNLYKVKTKSGAIKTFKPNYVQLLHIAERKAHRYNVILKARQHGITTLYCIDYLDEALWNRGMSCAILADTRQNADGIFEIVKRAFTFLPEGLKPTTKTDTKREYKFTHRFDGEVLDSSIYVALRVRSGTVKRLHITESSYIKDRAELNAGSKQAVPLTGSITEETTGNGFNQFYDFYMEQHAKQDNLGEYDYRTYFYGWHKNPEYTLQLNEPISDLSDAEIELKNKYQLTDGQIAWRRMKMAELRQNNVGFGLTGEQLFKQEYPISILEAFQSGSGNVFDTERVDATKPVPALVRQNGINEYHEQEEKLAKFNMLYGVGVKFWELPQADNDYVIGCDPSDGMGSDNSCIDVWHKDGLRQVAQFYGKVRPDELAEIINELARFYNEAFVGVENNMLTTILFLSKIYDNYYFETRVDEKTLKRTKKIGWSTNVKTRDLMIDEYNILFDEGGLTIRSPITLGEMKTFVKKDNGKREHADGKHDDALFSAFIAIQMKRAFRGRGRILTTKPF